MTTPQRPDMLTNALLDTTMEYISAISNKLEIVLKQEAPVDLLDDENQSELIRRLRCVNRRLSTLLDTIDL